LLFRNKSKKSSNLARKRPVLITSQAADGIITYSKTCHPNEGILILRGNSNKNEIFVDGLILPPFSVHGPYYSGFPSYDLPFDLSYIGTAHSHPSGSNKPSLEDLNNYYGSVSIIISHPYTYNTIAAFDRDGNNMELQIISSANDKEPGHNL
jgi:proteasome lid subunit RPN8/RPN11